ncbi:flagellar basal-body rod protein FlgF [Niveispirillum sp. SYP-B3756]|uniref:flagellar basal-body rod protein FlgF n=1 Tax=Niveispirillum sp. SYP-B3756 TaxID=2662178 RepID=UPI00129119CC|nr:flagellar basal-body rod protein FlgF [Niveispirillum sp. SYP-B3756]MQP66471.1 flagellar basal-body rod protein FlgF [Niveispirillum sp. SYP-B3756]
MENSLYITLSRQEALRRQMEVISNNVANMNTTGFKSQRMLFLEYLERPNREGDRMSFVQDYGLLRNTEAGPLSITNNQLDLALRGEGYFTVETLSGPRYTRGGAFQLNANREIVDRAGLPLLGENNQRITIPATAGQIEIQGDGTVKTEQGVAGKLKVVNFEDEQKLMELGGGLYSTDQDEIRIEQPQVTQGALESSNVQSVVEMTQMIDVIRTYQNVQKMIDTEHERIRTAIRQLARAQ